MSPEKNLYKRLSETLLFSFFGHCESRVNDLYDWKGTADSRKQIETAATDKIYDKYFIYRVCFIQQQMINGKVWGSFLGKRFKKSRTVKTEKKHTTIRKNYLF